MVFSKMLGVSSIRGGKIHFKLFGVRDIRYFVLTGVKSLRFFHIFPRNKEFRLGLAQKYLSETDHGVNHCFWFY